MIALVWISSGEDAKARIKAPVVNVCNTSRGLGTCGRNVKANQFRVFIKTATTVVDWNSVPLGQQVWKNTPLKSFYPRGKEDGGLMHQSFHYSWGH